MNGPMLPPQDLDAERAVLGACLLSAEAFTTAQTLISDDDWYRPHHMLIWKAMRDLADQWQPVDPVTVHAELARTVPERFASTNLALLLHDLVESVPSAAAVGHYCALVVEAGVRRRTIRALEHGAQRAYEYDGPSSELLADVQAELDVAQRIAAGESAVLSTPLTEFMADVTGDEPPPWVIPGLLARQDRLVLTGGGGIGKSTFVYQMLVCAAAGIQPLTPSEARYEPVRVSIFDCENPDYLTRSRLYPLLRQTRRMGVPDAAERITIAGHGNPINLLDPVVAAQVLATVEHDKPDVVYVGPFYKLHREDPNEEVVVKRVTDVIDRIRATGAVTIMEAHHNKEGRRTGPMEPSGSNMWTWWPEFGVGLRLDPDAPNELRLTRLERWRVDRMDLRSWPDAIEAGTDWPWQASVMKAWSAA